MAQKAATIFIIDVAPTMQIKQEGSKKTYLQTSIDAVATMLQDKLLAGRKSDQVSVILAGTEETSNSLAENRAGYENITTLQGIETPDNDLVRKLLNTTACKEPLTDIMSALILAVKDIHVHCRDLKYTRKIILFTDAESETDWGDVESFRKELESNNILLIIIIAGYDDRYPTNMSPNKTENIQQLEHMAEWNNVEMIMLNDAADQLSTFSIKNVHPTPVFRGDLNLGDVVEHPHQSLVVPVFMYARTYEAKLPTAKKWSALSETQTDEKFLTHDVGKEVAYKIKGSSNPVSNEDASADSYANGSADASTSASASAPTQASTSAPTSASAAGQITYEDLERAYPFGKSLVVITEEDEKFMKLSTKAGLFILGFVSADKIPRDYFMSNVYVVLPRPHNNEIAALSISALARALYEKNAYALVRYVVKDDHQPKIGVLVPHFEPNVDALHFIRIPFAEDIRQFPFAPLDVVVLPNGKEVKEHSLLPTKELEEAMDEFVSRMELPMETPEKPSFAPEKMYNPAVWRLNEAIKQRSLNEAAPIPSNHPVLQLQFEPLPLMMDVAREQITRLKEVANVYKVDETAGKKRRYGKRNQTDDAIAPVKDIVKNEETLKRYKLREVEGVGEGAESEEGVGAIMSDTAHIRKVGPIDPIRDFKAMIDPAKGDFISEAVQQMSDRIEQLVKESFADQYFDKAINCLKVLREECKNLEEGPPFNELCHRLKALCDPSNPQSQRLDFWKLMQKENISLLSKEEAGDVSVTQEQSRQFLTDVRTQASQNGAHEDTTMAERDDDLSADNLLDMLE